MQQARRFLTRLSSFADFATGHENLPKEALPSIRLQLNPGPKGEGWIELRNRDLLSRPGHDHELRMPPTRPARSGHAAVHRRGLCSCKRCLPGKAFLLPLKLMSSSFQGRMNREMVSIRQLSESKQSISAHDLGRHLTCTLITLAEILSCPAIENAYRGNSTIPDPC